MNLSVVVPIYEERDNIQPLYEALSAVLSRLGRSYEIIFVDDGSRDGSAELLGRLAERDRCVKVIEFRRNFGQTAAMHAGIQNAAGQVIVTMDGDLQNDPADIPAMLAKLEEGFDVVYGWRKQRQDAFWSRKLPSRAANWLIAKVAGFTAHDLGCGLKAIRAEIAQELPLYGEMHRFIPILAQALGARSAEIVTRHHPRCAGVTKYGLGRTFRVLMDLAVVQFMIRYFASPMRLFGGWGLFWGLLGLAAACGGALLPLGTAASSRLSEILLLGGILGMATGVQLAMLGLLGEVLTRSWFEGHGRSPGRIRRMLNFDRPTLSVVDRDGKSVAA